MTNPPDNNQNKSLRRRNLATLLVIVAFITLVYLINIIKLRGL